MTAWRSLPLDLEESPTGRIRLVCRFCEMDWPLGDGIVQAKDHVKMFHPDKAWCGHKPFANGHCAELSCRNYYMKFWELNYGKG